MNVGPDLNIRAQVPPPGVPSSIWARNIQLSAYSILFAVINLGTRDFEKVSTFGFFYGYSAITVFIICINGVGGLLVALVVKYADNILKGFATSVAVVLNTCLSVMFFGAPFSLSFCLGAALVLLSVFDYSSPNSQTSKATQAPKPAAVALALQKSPADSV